MRRGALGLDGQGAARRADHWRGAPARRQTRVGPAGIHYQEVGHGAPVVLLHGLSGSGRWWARNVPALARHHHIYIVDLIGFGRSRRAGRFVLREAAQHLLAWFDELGLERVSVVGHSMGGYIAADLAARAPGRIERLVLVDAVGLPLADPYWRRVVGLARALWRLPKDFLPVLCADAARAGPRTLWNAIGEVLTVDLAPRLTHIAAPTLVIWGARDAVLSPTVGRRLAACLPAARFALVPGAGHTPMWDRPAAFNRLLLDFLRGAPRAPRASAAPDRSSPVATEAMMASAR